MASSELLVIGDDPERLLARHQESYDYVLADVTQELKTRAERHAEAADVAGIRPTPEFKTQLSRDRAIREMFEGCFHWVYRSEMDVPAQKMLHNYVVFDGDQIAKACKKMRDSGTEKTPITDYSFNPLSSWSMPSNAMLPLTIGPHNAMTHVGDMPPYYEGRPCSNEAMLCDVDLDWVRRARQGTTADLQAKAEGVLRSAGLPAAYDWAPRYAHAWGETKENPTYFEQEKPKLLHARMPEHAKRVDFLLLDEAELNLFLNWSPIPVAGVIAERGYFSIDRRLCRSEKDDRFYQITRTQPTFLRALEQAWENAPRDTKVSVYRVKE